MPTFVGLDLAWTPMNETGVCIIEGSGEDARLVTLETRVDTPEGFAELCSSAGADVVAAIDAPLLVTPERRAESQLARQFRKYKAGAYSANMPFLTGMNGLAGPKLACLLRAAGFELDPAALSPQATGRFALEVFPHPAHVVLFGLDERLAYKRGSLPSRRLVLLAYQRHLIQLLRSELAGVLCSEDVGRVLAPRAVEVQGRALKKIEDQLDAITCAYVAYHCWRLGEPGFQVFGCSEHGCIVVPRLVPPATSALERSSPSGREFEPTQSLPPRPGASAPS